MDAASRQLGQAYELEVSEDGGNTWAPTTIRFATLRTLFAIRLSVPNLATVNLASLQGESREPAVPAASWWALIQHTEEGGSPVEPSLLFRLTCTVEADHALRHDAPRRVTAGSAYALDELLVLDQSEGWWHQDPDSQGGWVRVETGPTGLGGGDPSPLDTLRDLVRQRQDALEGVPVVASPQTWLMQFDKWRIGDRVSGVQGRGIAFGSNPQQSRHPTITGITLVLSEQSQTLRLHLEDEAPRLPRTHSTGGRRRR